MTQEPEQLAEPGDVDLEEQEEGGDEGFTTAQTGKRFPCRSCGAKLTFDPTADSLTCEYCGHVNPIPKSEEQIQELDLLAHLSQTYQDEPATETPTITCDACAAEFSFSGDQSSGQCPFCGSNVVHESGSTRKIKPKSLLPFAVNRDQAYGFFQQWLGKLWFAPNALKQYARSKTNKLAGMYVPYWTYDAKTTTFYRGQRGDDYYVTRTYTTTVNGKRVTRTRRVRKTRWTYVTGTVWVDFDDILVLASRSLPRQYTEKLEPWDLQNLQPYQDEYLAGYSAESYQVTLEEGFGEARSIMEDGIRAEIRRDIGGDHQRIHQTKTQYDGLTFKHILLPVWVSAYRFRDKVFRFLVNARTGEVQGERPWSWVKISLLAAAILVVIAVCVWVYLDFVNR